MVTVADKQLVAGCFICMINHQLRAFGDICCNRRLSKNDVIAQVGAGKKS